MPTRFLAPRRAFLQQSAGWGLGMGLLAVRPAQAQNAPAPAAVSPISPPPRGEFLYEAQVDIADPIGLGASPLGERRMVPITGGRFEGPGLRGTVLAGGADRQLLRRDGVRQLDAVYEMETDDGVVLSVRNQVLVHQLDGGSHRYALSHIEVVAPAGRYEWLNRYLIVGTLDSLRPQRQAVRIRAYKLV